ncbi:MHC class II transactivator [Rhinophrynus dorsalis]
MPAPRGAGQRTTSLGRNLSSLSFGLQGWANDANLNWVTSPRTRVITSCFKKNFSVSSYQSKKKETRYPDKPSYFEPTSFPTRRTTFGIVYNIRTSFIINTASGTPTVPAGKSIPGSPDRNCSSSPFTPAAADLPSSPVAASMSQCLVRGNACSQQSQSPAEPSHKEKEKNKYVDGYKAALMEKYRETLSLGSDIPYIDVGLVKSKIESIPGKVASKAAEKELAIYDLAEQEQETLELSNLFEDKDRKPMGTKIIALLGQSGMGKSVLVKKICQDWSAGKFPQFSLVICFECSLFNSYKKQYSLKDMLFELSSCPQERNVEIYQYILRNPEKVLLIFDGVDEFQDSEGLMHGSYTASPTKTHNIKELFTGLFQKKLLRGCTMLITARPKDKFNQYLGKVDQIVEIIGFSQLQVEWYINEYFKKLPDLTDALKWIKEHQYLFSYCYIPFMCRFMCLFTEANFKAGSKMFHLGLADLFANVLHKNQATSGSTSSNKTNLDCSTVNLTHIAEEYCEKSKNASTFQTKNLFTSTGNVMIQNFCTAQNLLGNIMDKNFVRYVSLEPKKKRNQETCQDMVRRFLLGLLFNKNRNIGAKFPKVPEKKKRNMSDYFKTLQLNTLCPQRLLELYHCLYEINSTDLIQHTALKLGEELSFVGTRLTPPDVYALNHVLKNSQGKISLDLRKTGINQEGLKELVGLKCVKSFRASLSDTVRLWKSLQADGNYRLLELCVKKFIVDPFKAKSMKDITDLSALVNIQNEICSCLQEYASGFTDIPAVTNLKKIIFGLGKKQGKDDFMALVDILPQLPALRHLDLHNLNENHIGDKGVETLAEKFPELHSLEMLDLSQNNITDVGAQKLAAALPSLHSLHTLSLYNNSICDTGAEHLAEILPKMSSLENLHLECNMISHVGAVKLTDSLRICPKMKSLKIYNTTIPHKVLQHLQQKDPRISCLSIG